MGSESLRESRSLPWLIVPRSRDGWRVLQIAKCGHLAAQDRRGFDRDSNAPAIPVHQRVAPCVKIEPFVSERRGGQYGWPEWCVECLLNFFGSKSSLFVFLAVLMAAFQAARLRRNKWQGDMASQRKRCLPFTIDDGP